MLTGLTYEADLTAEPLALRDPPELRVFRFKGPTLLVECVGPHAYKRDRYSWRRCQYCNVPKRDHPTVRFQVDRNGRTEKEAEE